MGELAAKEYAKFWSDPALPGLEGLHATCIADAFVQHGHEGAV